MRPTVSASSSASSSTSASPADTLLPRRSQESERPEPMPLSSRMRSSRLQASSSSSWPAGAQGRRPPRSASRPSRRARPALPRNAPPRCHPWTARPPAGAGPCPPDHGHCPRPGRGAGYRRAGPGHGSARRGRPRGTGACPHRDGQAGIEETHGFRQGLAQLLGRRIRQHGREIQQHLGTPWFSRHPCRRQRTSGARAACSCGTGRGIPAAPAGRGRRRGGGTPACPGSGRAHSSGNRARPRQAC